MSNELQKAAENASFQMWQAYCDKKMECEDLQEQVETQAARIAELERENRYLQDVCAELEAQVQQLQREKEGMCLLPAKEWGELDYWLARCEDKGHLENCPDLVEPYNALYAAIADHNIK